MGASAASGLLIVSTVSVVLGALGRSLRFDHPGWLVVGLATVFLTGIVLGVGLSSLFVLTRFGPQLSGALMYPVFLLAGLLTPISTLPSGIRWLSWGISLRWTMTYLSSAASGDPAFGALAMLLVLTVAYAVAGAYAFDRVSRIAREQGTIDLV